MFYIFSITKCFTFQKETVLRLFENQRRQKTDEFTQWCNEALSKLQSSVDSM